MAFTSLWIINVSFTLITYKLCTFLEKVFVEYKDIRIIKLQIFAKRISLAFDIRFVWASKIKKDRVIRFWIKHYLGWGKLQGEYFYVSSFAERNRIEKPLKINKKQRRINIITFWTYILK